jgi:archaellum biogenesis protein FlaJ (TadC family)
MPAPLRRRIGDLNTHSSYVSTEMRTLHFVVTTCSSPREDIAQLNKIFLAICGSRRLITVFTRVDPILSQLNPVHTTLPSYFFIYLEVFLMFLMVSSGFPTKTLHEFLLYRMDDTFHSAFVI